ncbi:MAG TPA: hypothetical protein ENN76_02845 [Euryarchaeota archaeon]|nr:hypothetical protein [Euryarchaeota archaeon]
MKRYGVYICHHCGNAFSKESKTKRSNCPRCDGKIKPVEMFPVFTTDDIALAAKGVRHANLTNLGGEDVEKIKESLLQWEREIGITADPYTKQLEKLKKNRDYTEEELVECLSLNIKKVKEFMSAAIERGDLYEPKAGHFRRI